MTFRARLRVLAALLAASCSSEPTGGGELLVVSQIDVQPPGASVIIGGTQQLSATPKTSSGITVPNRTVTWLSSDPGIATVSGSGLVTGVSVGPATITARVDAVTADVTVNVTPKPVASVSVEPPQVALTVGSAQQLLATPRDAQGQALQNRPVSFLSDNPAIASVSTTGLVVAITPGSTTIRATSEGITGTSAVTVNQRPASRLGFIVHPENGTAGQPLPPIRVAVQDELGGTIPEASTTITLSIADNAGGATLGGSITVNAIAGVATFNNVVLDKSGAGYTLRASAVPLSPAISNPFTIVAAAASRLVMVTQPPVAAQSGAPLTVQPVVQIADAQGNPVLQAGVAVSVQIVGAGATLAGVLTVPTAADGRATFTGLSLTGTSGSYSLRFAAPGLVEVVSNPIALSSGTAAGLLLLTPPSSIAQSGVPFAQQPVVQIVDVDNNPVALAGAPVSVAPASGGGTLAGVLTVMTNASGQAAFTGLSLSGAAGLHALVFTVPSLGQVISPPITLTGGIVPTQLGVTTQPSASAGSGVVFAQQPVVQLRDASNNPVLQAGVTITAAIASGGGTLLGTVTAITNASGAATFTNLAISGIVGNRTLQFTAAGLTTATSNTIAITPGPAAKLALTVQPSPTASSGVPFAAQPVVQIQDNVGNAVSQAGTAITAAIETGAGGTLGGGMLVITNGSGQATYTDLALTGTSGNYTLRFTAGGLTQVISNTIGLGAGAASNLAIATPPSASVQNGQAFPQQPAIQLQDGSNNPVAQAGVIITVTILSGNPALGGTLNATTNAAGLATFTNLAITGLIGPRTLIFAAAGFVSATSGTITVTPGAPAAIEFTTPPPAAAQSGAVLAPQPAVRLEDQSGNAVSQAGVSITASIASGGGSLGGTATVATNASGVATFTNLSISGLIGIRTLAFNSAGLTGVTSGNITLSAGAASQLGISQQPGTPATNGSALPTQPQVQLRDAAGNAVSQAGVLVTAVIGAGSPAGTLTNATATTDAAGLATFSGLTITGLVGTYTLQFTAAGLSASPLSSGILLAAGGATQLSITTQPGSAAQSGVAIPTQPAIQLRDQSGNPVSTNGVTITAVIATSPGGTPSLANASANTVSGLATFSGLAITGTAGAYTLQFTSGGLTPITSGTITLSAGAATTLDMFTEPSAAAQSGAAFATQPVIRARDGVGNNVGGVLITASIASGPGGATLGGTITATTAANGRAAFTNLSIAGLVGAYTLQFTTPGATAATSQTITLSAGAAAKLMITTQPSAAARNDVNFPTQPVIQVTDAGGNPVNAGGLNVTAGIASGGGALGGTVAVATVNGVATFTNLKITGLVGTRTLSFTSWGLTPATSNNVAVSAGVATQIVLFQQPPATVASGAVLTPGPVVDLRDVSGNDVDSAGIAIDVAISSGGGALGGTTTVATAANGRATFSDLTITGSVGNRQLQFTHGGLAGATSSTVGVTAASPTTITISQQPSSAAANDVVFGQQPIVNVTDGVNPVANASVTVTLLGGGTLSGTSLSVLTDGAGNASFSGLKIVGLAGSRNLRFTVGALTPVDSDPITLSAGSATQLAITVQPSAAATENLGFAQQPTVVLRDSGGNLVAANGVDIVASIVVESGTGTLGGTTTVATTGGASAFADLFITLAGTYRIRFSSGALPTLDSGQIVVTP